MREKVLNIIVNNLETVIKEDLKNIVTNKKMEKDRVKKYKENVETLLKNCYSKEKE